MILDDFSVEIDGSLELIAGLCLSDLFLDSLKDCAYWTGDFPKYCRLLILGCRLLIYNEGMLNCGIYAILADFCMFLGLCLVYFWRPAQFGNHWMINCCTVEFLELLYAFHWKQACMQVFNLESVTNSITSC